MNPLVRHVRDFVVSLKLTVVLLALSLVLIFAGTLAQVELGIWAVQKEFFRSFIAVWHVGPLYIPMPGGYLIGGLLLINLISAHIYRFKFTWRKTGIQLTHIGLILLLVGELLSGLWQEDFSMRLTRDQPKNYAESQFGYELALVDTTDSQFDEVVAIPSGFLAKGEPLQHPKLPFRVVPKQYYFNSAPLRPRSVVPPAGAPPSLATAGLGPDYVARAQPTTNKMDERNAPTAFVELVGTQGSLGTWLVSDAGVDLDERQPLTVFPTQRFEHDGRTWEVSLRPGRAYKPFTLTLLKFSHDKYAGTDIPKNFSSQIRLTTPDGRDDREVLIYMNNPLRYGGLTFYQASYDPRNPDVTILQVVRNPSWLIPYVACGLMTFGLLVQFGIHLVGFVEKRRSPRPALA